VPSQSSHKSSPRSQQKKQQILQQALMCFVEHGVPGTTIDMIREATQTSVGSLYHHFGNKDAIVGAVYREGMRDFAMLLKGYLQDLSRGEELSEQDAKDGVKALVFANVDWISQQPLWAQYVFQHRASVVGQAKLNFNADSNLFNSFITNWFAPYIEGGFIKDYPLELLNAFVTGPVHNYARHWLAGRHEVPLSEYREDFAEAAWSAVRSG